MQENQASAVGTPAQPQVSMVTTAEHGISSVNIELVEVGGPGSLGDLYNEVLKLLLDTQHEWEFEWSLARLIEECEDRSNILLRVDNGEAYFLLKKVQYPSGKTALTFIWSNGNSVVKYAEPVMKAMLHIGRVLKVSRIEMGSRPAWGKILRGYGVREIGRHYVKEL